VNLTGTAIAQDWRNLEAEWAPSNFDQRHLLTVQFQYSTGVGIGGGTLIDGVKGMLFKGWTVTSQLTTGSGLPLTPVYLTSVTGTGVTGTLRPDVVGAAGAAADGFYLNPSAFAAPAAGSWGNAGRNSITGPAQFSLNSGLARTFTLSDRLSLDWRIDAANILNRVTYAGVNTIFGSPEFGLPSQANTMRKLQTTKPRKRNIGLSSCLRAFVVAFCCRSCSSRKLPSSPRSPHFEPARAWSSKR
jgi:hypothetical protein